MPAGVPRHHRWRSASRKASDRGSGGLALAVFRPSFGFRQKCAEVAGALFNIGKATTLVHSFGRLYFGDTHFEQTGHKETEVSLGLAFVNFLVLCVKQIASYSALPGRA